MPRWDVGYRRILLQACTYCSPKQSLGIFCACVSLRLGASSHGMAAQAALVILHVYNCEKAKYLSVNLVKFQFSSERNCRRRSAGPRAPRPCSSQACSTADCSHFARDAWRSARKSDSSRRHQFFGGSSGSHSWPSPMHWPLRDTLHAPKFSTVECL